MRSLLSARMGRIPRPLFALILTFAPIQLARADDALDSPLVKILKKGGLPEERQATIVEMVVRRGAEGDKASDLGYVFDQAVRADGFPAPVRRKALAAMAEAAVTSKTRPSGDLSRLKTLISESDPALRLAAIRLAGLWKVEPLTGQLATIAGAKATPDGVRAAALGSLAGIGNNLASKSIAVLMAPDHPVSLRALAVAALASLDLDASSKAAVAVLKDAGKDQDFAPMIAPFLSLKGGSERLAAAIDAGNVPPDSAKLALRALYALGRADPSLVDVLSKAGKLNIEVKPPDKAEVDRMIADVASQGDPARGERVFRRADLNCMKCHAVAGAAGGIGPELSAIGSTSPVDYLINSIMVPDQSIKEEYVTKVVQTTDGRVYYGIVVDKDDKRLVLREATGETRTIPAGDIEDTKDGGSLMPKGLANFLTRAEFVDLLRFLSELGKPGPYAIHSTASPTIQRWRVLKRELTATGETQEVKGAPIELFEDCEDLWISGYSLVDGTLPLALLITFAMNL